MTRLVWLFLFINVYWWSSSISLPIDGNSNISFTNFFTIEPIIEIIFHLAIIFVLCSFLHKTVIKNYSNNNMTLLLLVLSFIAFCLNWYVVWAYLFIGAIFLYIGMEKFQFDKATLQVENHKIDFELLPDLFELKYYHIIFIVVSLIFIFFFNVLFGVFYLIFIALGVIGGFFEFNIYKIIPKRLYLYSKNFKKDLNTMKYHWGTHFFFFKIFNRLSLVSLPLGLLVLAFALYFPFIDNSVFLLNACEIGILSCILFIGSFLIDLYIILFGNSTIVNKLGVFCYRCALYGSSGLATFNVAERQFMYNGFDRFGWQWQPTFLTNGPRVLMGKPIFLDADQYWHYNLIQKYLPEISEEQYISKRNNIVSQINSTKTNEIIRENWDTVSQNATSQELRRIKLFKGWFSDEVSRK